MNLIHLKFMGNTELRTSQHYRFPVFHWLARRSPEQFTAAEQEV